MKKYEVTCKFRPSGAIGTLFMHKTVIVEADNENEARLKAIEVVHLSGNYEHVTPYDCRPLTGESP